MTRIIILIVGLFVVSGYTAQETTSSYFNRLSFATPSCEVGSEQYLASYSTNQCLYSSGYYLQKQCSQDSSSITLTTTYFSDSECKTTSHHQQTTSTFPNICSSGTTYSCTSAGPPEVMADLPLKECVTAVEDGELFVKCSAGTGSLGAANLLKVSPFLLVLAYFTSLFF